jgi:hypothetical protein
MIQSNSLLEEQEHMCGQGLNQRGDWKKKDRLESEKDTEGEGEGG